MVVSLLAQNAYKDGFDQIYTLLKSHEAGKCGYSYHQYHVDIIDRHTSNFIYGDSIAPLYDNYRFKLRIVDLLNISAARAGYDTLEYSSKWHTEDIELKTVFNFDCCPDFALAKYRREFRGFMFLGYSAQTDSIYMLSDIYNERIKTNFNRIVSEYGASFVPDPICKAILVISLKYAIAAPVILKTEKDIMPPLIDQHEPNLECPVVLSTGNLYFYEPYEQADSSKKIYYDLVLANDDFLRANYHDIIDSMSEKGLTIIPPELRQGSDADTVILTVYHTTNQHLAWWYVVFDKAGLLDTLIAHDYLYISGEQFDFFKSKSDE